MAWPASSAATKRNQRNRVIERNNPYDRPCSWSLAVSGSRPLTSPIGTPSVARIPGELRSRPLGPPQFTSPAPPPHPSPHTAPAQSSPTPPTAGTPTPRPRPTPVRSPPGLLRRRSFLG